MKNRFAQKIACFYGTWLCFAWFGATMAWAEHPREVDHESRTFRISVDGKERGQCTMEIDTFDDGSEKMQIEASLTFDYKVYVYRYHSKGMEIWKNGRLTQLENLADLNKTKVRLQCKPTANGLLLAVDGKVSDLPADTWVTSYWHIPDPLVQRLAAENSKPEKSKVVPAGGVRPEHTGKPKVVRLLDSDKGLKLRGEIVHVGNEMLTVAGKRHACDHYRISGDVHVDVWYDDTHRLVRQQGVESGHKTLLELTQLTK